MRCVHGERLEMPRAPLSRTMYRPECVWEGFLHFKIAAWEAVSFQLGGRFATRVLRLAGKSMPALGCSGVTLKCPLCGATVPWSELRTPPLDSQKSRMLMGSPPFGPNPRCLDPPCFSLSISQNKTGIDVSL